MFQPDKANLESKENKAAKDCIQQLVLEHEYSGDPNNKQDLYNQIQSDWLVWAEERKITEGLDATNEEEYVRELKDRVRRFAGGFGSSPKLYNILSKATHGVDCLSGSMIIGALLDKANIKYSYVNPVGHIALFVDIGEKVFYVDVGANRFLEIGHYIDRIEKEKDFDIHFLKSEPASKAYSFFAKYKNKADIAGSVLENIYVLNQILEGNPSGASSKLEQQTAAALSVKEKVQKIDFKALDKYLKLFPNFFASHEELCMLEEKRLKSIGFHR